MVYIIISDIQLLFLTEGSEIHTSSLAMSLQLHILFVFNKKLHILLFSVLYAELLTVHLQYIDFIMYIVIISLSLRVILDAEEKKLYNLQTLLSSNY